MTVKKNNDGSHPDAWLVGLEVFRTHGEALAAVRNPDLVPIPLYRETDAEYERGYVDGHQAGYDLCRHERT